MKIHMYSMRFPAKSVAEGTRYENANEKTEPHRGLSLGLKWRNWSCDDDPLGPYQCIDLTEIGHHHRCAIGTMVNRLKRQ